MMTIKHIDIACDGHKNIPRCGSLDARHYTIAVHYSLKCACWVNFANNDIGTQTMSTGGDTTTAPTIAKNNNGTTSNQDIRRTNNRIERTLTGTITIVKHMFGVRIIYRQNR